MILDDARPGSATSLLCTVVGLYARTWADGGAARLAALRAAYAGAAAAHVRAVVPTLGA